MTECFRGKYILEKNNNDLKKRIEIMLKSYDSRIVELEEDNAKIKEEYSKAYEMLPKYKQKQLQKESKSENSNGHLELIHGTKMFLSDSLHIQFI